MTADVFPDVADTLSGTSPPTVDAQRRRVFLFIAGLLAIVVGLVAVFLILRPEPPRGDRPVVLPKTLQGLPMADHQFADNGWRTVLRNDKKAGFGDHPFDGRSFQARKGAPMVNLTVVRDDARAKGDLFSEHKPFTTIGQVSCRHPFPISRPVGTAGDHRALTCWRASETLTVSVFVLTSPREFEKTMARAIDEVWALQN